MTNYDYYWYLAAERQRMWYHKLRHPDNGPITKDNILLKYKFTNAYRVLDRTSQWLIKHIIKGNTFDEDDLFFRILLFKTFNRVSTWLGLVNQLGREISWHSYNYNDYNNAINRMIKEGSMIYSAAYMHPSSGVGLHYPHKHQCHFHLIEMMMKDDITDKVISAKSLEDVCKILGSYPMIGDFLSYQYAIDLNYSNLISFDEDDFVCPGPGAVMGISKCFPTLSVADIKTGSIIKKVCDDQCEEFNNRGIQFLKLGNRRMHLVDIQNVFCELNKYLRVLAPQEGEMTRLKQTYQSNGPLEPLIFPDKWGAILIE
jgi:hypothetical protein